MLTIAGVAAAGVALASAIPQDGPSKGRPSPMNRSFHRYGTGDRALRPIKMAGAITMNGKPYSLQGMMTPLGRPAAMMSRGVMTGKPIAVAGTMTMLGRTYHCAVVMTPQGK